MAPLLLMLVPPLLLWASMTHTVAARRSRDATAAQLRTHRDEFDHMDTNDDGWLVAAELIASLAEPVDTSMLPNAPLPPSADDIRHFVHELDTDKDGRVSWNEYKHALLTQGVEPELPQAFGHDMDGFVAAANELSEARARGEEL